MLFLSMVRPEHVQDAHGESVAMELRLDLFQNLDLEYVKSFLQRASCPVMLTLRKTSHGGKFKGTELEREALIKRLLTLNPPFFDLEYDMNPKFLRETLKSHPKTKFVLSYHHFQETPTDPDEIYRSMQKYPAFCYKIAAMANSTNDALKLLLFVRKHPQASAICMGEKGGFARVLGPIAGNLIDYASIDSKEQTGPGQLTEHELIDVYHFPSLNKNTSIYGLIGDPVENSPGHLYHNAAFRNIHLNAVYVKMAVKANELADFISLAKELGIRGVSVTIPLKEAVLPFVDEVDETAKRIGAVNTLLFAEGRIKGTNTDGIGALDAIEKKISVQGKKMVLLGAGGAARSIAFEAKARGADVLALNRTVERAKKLATDIGCEGGGLNEVPDHYDILVNCSPDPMPIDPKKIQPTTVVMDSVYHPRETPFLKEASSRHCRIVYGEEMFLNQAARQTAFWMGP
ncbi:MAG: shikimate dehydrogenase [Waddliaceae bacterium]